MELQSVSQEDFSSGIFHSRSVKKSTHFFFFFSLLMLTELKTLYELSMHFFPVFPPVFTLHSVVPSLLCCSSLEEEGCLIAMPSAVQSWAVIERRTGRKMMSKAAG